MSKTWFITGASRGLGADLAAVALKAGDRVVATSRQRAAVSDRLGPDSDQLLSLSLDVGDAGQAHSAVAEAMARFGSIDVLVNNAGYGHLGFFEETTPEDVEAQFATNVFGLLNVTRAALPAMRAARAGRIFNLSSVAGMRGTEMGSLYCASKWAVEGFSEALALELAPFGVKVTLIEMLPQILPVEDEEVAKLLERSFTKQGIAIHTGTKCENIRSGEKSVKLDLVKDGAKTELEVETILVAIGITAALDGLVSPKVKLDLDRGFVKVDANYQTSTPGVYAAGDIQGPPWLAHVASFRAVQAVEGMFGISKPKLVGNFPGCTYCQPQVASTGLTEKQAKEKKLDFKVGKFPFTAVGKAVAAGDTEGFVKVIADAKTGEILGVHIIGSEATELIAEYVMAIDQEITIEEIHHSIHAHPTLSEALGEAALASLGQAIHI